MLEPRRISWLKGALRDFKDFPAEVRADAARALAIAARGGNADTAKPFKGVGSGVFEIALRHKGDAYRVIYDVQIGEALWVVPKEALQ
jgi:phage-related protein